MLCNLPQLCKMLLAGSCNFTSNEIKLLARGTLGDARVQALEDSKF